MPGNVTELSPKRAKAHRKQPEEAPERTPELPASEPSAVPVADKKFPPWPRGAGRGNFAKCEEVIAYWQSLPTEFINRTNFYVNREKPVLDRLQEFSEDEVRQMREHKRRYPAKYIDKPDVPWEPDGEFRMYFLERYGSGEYKIFLNDAGLARSKDPDLESRNLCKAVYSVWDSAYPPILDPSRPDKGLGILDWKHPANASYVADLRMKGLIPPGEKKEDDVPNDVVKTLVDKVGTLADKVATQEQERLVDRIAERVGPQQGSAGTALDLVRAVKELTPAAPVAAPPNDMGRFTEMMAAFKSIMPPPAPPTDNAMLNTIVTLMTQQVQSSQQRAEKLEAQVFALLQQRAEPVKADTFETLLEKADVLIPKLKSLFDISGEKVAEVVHGRKREWWQDLVLQVAGPLANSIGPAIPMLFAPRPTQQIPGTASVPAALPPPAAPSPEQQRVGAFLSSNISPMQKYFEDFVQGKPIDPDEPNEKTTGGDFAAWISQYHGDAILKDARTLGSGQILQMFRQSPLWAQLQAYEAKLSEFLDQVLSYQPEPPDAENDSEVKIAEEA